MSGVNIFLEPSRALVFTDGSFYDGENILLKIDRKCWPVDGTKMVVAGRGNAWFHPALAQYLPTRAETIDDVEDDGEALIDCCIDWSDELLNRAPRRDLDVFIVGWSDRDGRAKCAQYTTMPPPGVPKFKMADSVMAPDIPDHEVARIQAALGPMRREIFDVTKLAVPLMEAQRRTPGDPRLGCAGQYCIGGHILQTEVTAKGVIQRIIHEWPEDRVGERIRPTPAVDFAASPNVVPIAGMNRAERRRLEKARRKAVAA